MNLKSEAPTASLFDCSLIKIATSNGTRKTARQNPTVRISNIVEKLIEIKKSEAPYGFAF